MARPTKEQEETNKALLVQGLKICCYCNETLTISQFSKHPGAKDKYSNVCKTCKSQYDKRYRKNNPDKIKDNHLQKNYGISVGEYNRMFNEQEGKCWICGTHQSELVRALATDHCHTTGTVRGLLCPDCNLGLGKFKDNTVFLANAIKYITRH